MLGDMFNEHGEEDNMMRLALKADPSSISGFGFEIWGVGYGENGEPYIYITKRGMWNRLEHEPDKYPAECRLSLAVPRYIQYNEMLTEEELEWVVTFLHNNWDLVIGVSQDSYDDLFKYGSKLDGNSVCPDYSTLETL